MCKIKIILMLIVLSSFYSCQKNSSSKVIGKINSNPIYLSATRSWEETGTTCLIDAGKTYCWSMYGYPTGFNTFSTTSVPTLIPGLPETAIQVANYSNRVCVLFQDGSVRCLSATEDPSIPVFTSGVTKIAVNSSVTCAIVNSALKCWGRNDDGRLGTGDTTDSLVPVDVTGMNSGVTDVSVGLRTVCAIKSGAAFCWGDNSGGQLGNGTIIASLTPVAVSGLSTGVTAISASYGGWGSPGDSVFAIKDGALFRWGMNDYGQLGDGTTVSKSSPVSVPELASKVTAVDTGGTGTCAIMEGNVWCFGLSNQGQLGFSDDSASHGPRKILGLTGTILQLAVGSVRGCASTSTRVYCWGNNNDNVINPNNTLDQPTPVAVYSK